MTGSDNSGGSPLLHEGLDWVVRIGPGARSADDQAALQEWIGRSAAHATAWREAMAIGRQMRVIGREIRSEQRLPTNIIPFERPAALDGAALDGSGRAMLGRRRFFGMALAASALAVVAGGREFDLLPEIVGPRPDFATGTGERRVVALAAGLTLELDTQSSITVDRSAAVPVVELLNGRAEVAAAMPGDRPFVLIAGAGRISARAARFDVRVDREASCVTCLQGEMSVAQGEHTVPLLPRQQVNYTDAAIDAPRWIDPAEVTAWKHGQLIFHETPLSEVIREVNRYRPGRVLIANAVLRRRSVNGIFHIADTDAVIVQVQQITGARALALPGGVVVLS